MGLYINALVNTKLGPRERELKTDSNEAVERYFFLRPCVQSFQYVRLILWTTITGKQLQGFCEACWADTSLPPLGRRLY